MVPPAPSPTLTCKECSYLNEPERVYCHNCGAKLDRSILPREEQIRREPPDRARKRIMKMTNPGNHTLRRVLGGVIKCLIFAALAAGFLLMLQTPENAPAGKPELSLRSVSSTLLELVNSNQQRSVVFTQDEVNSYLGTVKVSKEGVIPGVTYQRTYSILEPGTARITLERSFWGYPVYFGTLYHVEAANAVLSVANLGGNIGRLAISPSVMKYLAPYLFKDIRETFKNEFNELQQLALLRVEQGKVSLVSSGHPR